MFFPLVQGAVLSKPTILSFVTGDIATSTDATSFNLGTNTLPVGYDWWVITTTTGRNNACGKITNFHLDGNLATESSYSSHGYNQLQTFVCVPTGNASGTVTLNTSSNVQNITIAIYGASNLKSTTPALIIGAGTTNTSAFITPEKHGFVLASVGTNVSSGTNPRITGGDLTANYRSNGTGAGGAHGSYADAVGTQVACYAGTSSGRPVYIHLTAWR